MQTTSFVGREREVKQLVELVRAHRLVTLTGVGGVGKTRLALQVAAGLAGEFPTGCGWSSWRPSATRPPYPTWWPPPWGSPRRPGGRWSTVSRRRWSGRQLLVVLDNCEHVLDAAAELVEAVLARTASVKVLATSREGLRVGAEQLWAVPSLGMDGPTSEAVTLFVERARSGQRPLFSG